MGHVLKFTPSANTDLLIFIFLSIPLAISDKVNFNLILISLPVLFAELLLLPPKKLSKGPPPDPPAVGRSLVPNGGHHPNVVDRDLGPYTMYLGLFGAGRFISNFR